MFENRVSRVALSLRRDEREAFFRHKAFRPSVAFYACHTPSSSRGGRGLLCFAEAEPWMHRAAEILTRSLGAEHPSTQTVRRNLEKLLAAS